MRRRQQAFAESVLKAAQLRTRQQVLAELALLALKAEQSCE